VRRIIACGGGAFSPRKPRPSFDRWLLAQTGKRRPRVCFIPTASGDTATYVEPVERAVRRLGGMTTTLSLFSPPGKDLKDLVCRHDLVFVGGGNTRNMLALWRLWKLDIAVRQAYERGVILAGTSAGALCWFSSGLTDSFGPRYAPLKCLGWLRGSFCPHFDSEKRRRPMYRRLIRRGELPGGYAVDDGVALEFVDDRLARAVSCRPKAGAFRLRREGARLRETPLPIERIG